VEIRCVCVSPEAKGVRVERFFARREAREAPGARGRCRQRRARESRGGARRFGPAPDARRPIPAARARVRRLGGDAPSCRRRRGEALPGRLPRTPWTRRLKDCFLGGGRAREGSVFRSLFRQDAARARVRPGGFPRGRRGRRRAGRAPRRPRSRAADSRVCMAAAALRGRERGVPTVSRALLFLPLLARARLGGCVCPKGATGCTSACKRWWARHCVCVCVCFLRGTRRGSREQRACLQRARPPPSARSPLLSPPA
jgi:hypothetical protein